MLVTLVNPSMCSRPFNILLLSGWNPYESPHTKIFANLKKMQAKRKNERTFLIKRWWHEKGKKKTLMRGMFSRNYIEKGFYWRKRFDPRRAIWKYSRVYHLRKNDSESYLNDNFKTEMIGSSQVIVPLMRGPVRMLEIQVCIRKLKKLWDPFAPLVFEPGKKAHLEVSSPV